MAVVCTLNTLAYDPARCIGCGLCAVVCPHGVFAAPALKEVEAGPAGRPTTKREVAHLARPEACMECGACQLNCPTGAIKVESGVGCAAAMIRAALAGRKVASCDGPACCGGASPQSPEGQCACERGDPG